MLTTGLDQVDAQQAFVRARRSRRRAALGRRLRRRPAGCGRLAVYDGHSHAPVGRGLGIRAIPIEAIAGTLEPSRATMFDGSFRPAAAARPRWERVWLAEQRGTTLPPISVVQVGDGYAVADGHHRVSVARARGAIAIDAAVLGRAA
ncbi:MAG: hypothetical protein QOE86_1646 [Solirubrobacteraceae bacterium]|nr:hypothetical protein [Solirubrobacteraceae bacterium]